MQILNNVTVGDNYTDAATMQNVLNSNGGYFLVQGNDVFLELQYNIQGQLSWTKEIHVPTGSGQIYPGTTGIRFRNFVAGSAAVVSGALSENKEPAIVIGSSGTIGGTTTALQVVTALPASPTNGLQCAYTDSLTVPTYTWFLQFDTALLPTIGWRFLGGSKIQAVANAVLTLPRAGNYDVTITGFLEPQTANPQSVAFVATPSVGSIVGKNTIEWTASLSGGSQVWPDGVSQFKLNGATAGTTLTWGLSSGVGSLVNGIITATPILLTG